MKQQCNFFRCEQIEIFHQKKYIWDNFFDCSKFTPDCLWSLIILCQFDLKNGRNSSLDMWLDKKRKWSGSNSPTFTNILSYIGGCSWTEICFQVQKKSVCIELKLENTLMTLICVCTWGFYFGNLLNLGNSHCCELYLLQVV